MGIEDVILPDENVIAVGIDTIEVIIGGIEVSGEYIVKNETRGYSVQLHSDWLHRSIKEIESFIQREISGIHVRDILRVVN